MENKTYLQKIEAFQRSNFPKLYRKIEIRTYKVVPDPSVAKYVAPAVVPSGLIMFAVLSLFATRYISRVIEFQERMFAFGGIGERDERGRLVKKYPKWKFKKEQFLFKQHPLNTTFGIERYEELIVDIKRLKGISLSPEEPRGGWHVFKILETHEQVEVD